MAKKCDSRGAVAGASPWRRLCPALTALFLAASCGPFKTDYEIARERAHAYVAENPGLAETTRDTILRNELHAGMTKEQVLAAWGPPIEVTRFEREELWRFGCFYPHYCRDLDPGQSIHRFDRIWYESWAIFEEGRVTRFHR